MSRLTSYTSASDALIQPTGATSGQTLAWNSATGQFEPVTPASGAVFVGATASVAGALGTVPQPLAGDQDKYLKGDGTWGTINSATAVASQGDRKWSDRPTDHGDWVLLDGRLKSTLTPARQAVATSLGIGTNLPDMRGRFPLGTSGTFAALTSGGSSNIAQNQLPNVNLGSTTYNGIIGGSVNTDSSTSGVAGVPTFENGSGNITSFPVNNNGNVLMNVFLNGNVTQQPFLPNYSTGNWFIWLGAASPTVTVSQALSLTTTGSGAATFDSGTGVLNIPTSTTLPTFTNLNGLRGDGTNIPVADSRLKYGVGGTQTMAFVEDTVCGLSIGNGGTSLQMNVSGTATAAGAAFNFVAQNGTGLDAAGGWLNFFPGISRGTGFTATRFYTSQGSAVSSTTQNPTVGAWQIYNTSLNETIWECWTPTGTGVIQGISGKNMEVRALTSGNLNLNTNAGSLLLRTTSGNMDISPQGTGQLSIGQLGTGNITVGVSTKTTTLNGIVKQPNRATLYTTGTVVALPANVSTVVPWAAALNTTGSGISLASNTITVTRTGQYRVYGCLSIVSATANARGQFAVSTGTAVISNAPSQAVRLQTANIPMQCQYNFLLNVTTAGTFTINCVMTSASQIEAFNNGTATAATTTLYIEEVS